jgi:hypothetical protein
MTTQTEITQRNHHRAVRFFWSLLIGATVISLLGNVTHAVLPYIPHVLIQIGAAAVPPIVLLAAVHGIALAVRAGASGWVYYCAIGAVAAIGLGAFAMSFLALQDLMRAIGYSPKTAWVFPVIIDTTLAVCTLMLVALGDKPARRAARVAIQTAAAQKAASTALQSATVEAPPLRRIATPQTVQPAPVQSVQDSVQTSATQVDADLALELIALGVTTQPVETVTAVLAARRGGASTNAAAKASGINYRTAQRIVEAAQRQGQLVAIS